MSDEHETVKCLLCNRVLRDDENQTCLRCVERLDEILGELVDLYALLPSVLLPGSVPPDGTPHGKRAFAPAPVRLDVVDALDSRRIVGQIGGLTDERRGAVGVLNVFTRRVADERGFAARDGEPTVAGEVAFLRKHLTWILDQPFADEFDREIRALHRDLRQVTGDSGPKPIGACPAEYIENGQVVVCGRTLYAPLTGDVVRCGRCRSQWTRDRWLLLGKILEDGEGA